jgi:hypothetical protein
MADAIPEEGYTLAGEMLGGQIFQQLSQTETQRKELQKSKKDENEDDDSNDGEDPPPKSINVQV